MKPRRCQLAVTVGGGPKNAFTRLPVRAPMWRTLALGLCIATTAIALPGCLSSGPATKQDLCASFANLGQQVLSPHLSDNVIFRDAGSLADTASRYDSDQTVKDSAARLKSIADGSSTSVSDLMNATTAIAAVCGHPLGIG
jgi:hypothetical protein